MLPVAAYGAGTVYKSVDEAGHVTYSLQPPKDAIEIEDVQIEPGPSAGAAEKARERAKDMGQMVDVHYQQLMERREQEEQARKEAREAAERERIAREAAARQRRIEESLAQIANERYYFGPSPYDWRWHYPPYRPMYPSYPPRRPPRHPIPPGSRPYKGHIDTPERRQ